MFEMTSAAVLTSRGRESVSACLGWARYQSSGSLSLCLSLACVILEPQPTKSTAGRLRPGLANLISCLSYWFKGQTDKCSILSAFNCLVGQRASTAALGQKMTRSGGL